jgi:hypothetical protein
MFIDDVYINENQITKIDYGIVYKANSDAPNLYRENQFTFYSFDKDRAEILVHNLKYGKKSNVIDTNIIIDIYHKDYNKYYNKINNLCNLNEGKKCFVYSVKVEIKLSCGSVHVVYLKYEYDDTYNIKTDKYNSIEVGEYFDIKNITIEKIYDKLINNKGLSSEKIVI